MFFSQKYSGIIATIFYLFKFNIKKKIILIIKIINKQKSANANDNKTIADLLGRVYLFKNNLINYLFPTLLLYDLNFKLFKIF